MSTNLQRAVLVAFVVLDVVLVVGVFRHVNRTPPPAGVTAGAGNATPTASPAPGDSDQRRFTFRPPRAWFVSVGDDGSVVMASRGQCDGDVQGAVSVSSDGGASTRAAAVDLAEVLAVSVVSRTDITVVGATSTCEVRQRSSSDGGATWSTDSAVTLWHPDVRDARTVVTPTGPSRPGCTVTSLSQVGDDFGRVTCSDGRVYGTGNRGAEWLRLGRLDNVRVASFSTFNAGYALAAYRGCAAQEFTTRDSGRTWAAGGCISGERAQAIASSDTVVTAVVDGELYTSDDAGASWRQP